MAHGVSEVIGGDGSSVKMVNQKQQAQQSTRKSVGVMGSRRIFAPAFKLKVLDSYRNDIDCRGNQRATARKYGIHRRQIQKWLQCEDNLRNSCAENGNTGGTTASTIASVGASKQQDGTVTEATGSTVTPAAPALNLSLARLHGDELTARQGVPPPLISHPPPHHGGSPSSSPRYTQPGTSTTILPNRLGYHTEYSSNPHDHRQLHARRDTEESNGVQVTVDHRLAGYTDVRGDQEVNYYALNSDGRYRDMGNPTSYDNRTESKVYQTLSNYGVSVESRQEMTNYGNDLRGQRSPVNELRRHSSRETYGDVDPSQDSHFNGLLLAPSMIKTERASPDSAATPGPCESNGSPVVSRVLVSHSPISHTISGSNSSSTSSTVSVHLKSPRDSVSPRLHASPSLDSEKWIPRGESTIISSRRIAREEDNSMNEVEIGKALIKEEVELQEDEMIVALGSSSTDSRPTSPVPEREGYSLPSSPRGPNSSGRSSTSCSDSEMDPLDCSSGSQHSSTDLTRRRSFSLRFKLDVLDAFHRDVGVAGNQRATARKFGINRRQVQKWLGQETELRGEIALRGNARQRLGPIQDAVSGESPVDLRTSNCANGSSHDRIETLERERSPVYCCDIGSSTQHISYYQHPTVLDATSDGDTLIACNLSCCNPGTSCYQDAALKGSCYSDSQTRLYCYSPRDYSSEITSIPEQTEERLSSPLKRQHCTLSCCYDPVSSPKRVCLDTDDSSRTNSCQEMPPQDTPLCLVKPKRLVDLSPSRTEQVTSTAPTPPSQGPTSKKDAILFKPYLDNPVSKPSKEHVIRRDSSPVCNQNIVHNNNCQSICNLNEGRGHDYALELSLRLPVSWRTHPSPYTEFPQVRSAFVRYPASPHYS